MSQHARFFFHSFSRPKKGESREDTQLRAINILRFMKSNGLVLAPEVVEWQIEPAKKLSILQRRACFTELSTEELPEHAEVFGPISLQFDLDKLRMYGLIPVIYTPQSNDSPLSHISTFAANAAWHTRAVLQQLLDLKQHSDPKFLEEKFGYPVAPSCALNLQNADGAGNIVAEYAVPISHVRDILNHLNYNNIPFDHSIAMLSVFLSTFYPTDNVYVGDVLGYYRQREWRLIGGDLKINEQPIARELSDAEREQLLAIDPTFWARKLTDNGIEKTRVEWAQIYDPGTGWDFFSLVDGVFAPDDLQDKVRAIVGDKTRAYTQAAVAD